MPKHNPISDALASDELLLAALDRAERHNPRTNPGVILATFKAHLGLPRDGASTRRLRPQLEVLQAAGHIERIKRNGVVLWALTTAGAERLEAAHLADATGALPESPQHRAWREARSAAAERLGGFRSELLELVDEAIALLDAGPQTSADEWFAFSERMKRVCWRIGSATHCLCEWSEPDDSQADIDEQGPLGRRNLLLWEDR